MKFIIKWDAGYGESAEIVETKNEEEAEGMAYDAWREEAESAASYSAEPYTKEEAYNLSLEDEDDD